MSNVEQQLSVPSSSAQSDVTTAMEDATIQEWGIEGTRSQEFSVGIFIFLIISIIVFTAIVIRHMATGKGKRLKTGEKILFAWIFLGVIAGVVMGISQLLYGQLL